LMNCEPLSLDMRVGVPYLVTYPRIASAASEAVAVFNGINSVHLEKASTRT
jgi:hypothetical protein